MDDPPSVRIFLATEPADMRRSFDGPAAKVINTDDTPVPVLERERDRFPPNPPATSPACSHRTGRLNLNPPGPRRDLHSSCDPRPVRALGAGGCGSPDAYSRRRFSRLSR